MSPAVATLAATLKARSGLMIGADKLYLLETRLAGLMRREGLRDLQALAERLRPGSALERDVVEAMTTNESLFFRDGKPFDVLHRRILPLLHQARAPEVPIRLWSAASSTGQEAYSLAMVASELAPMLGGRRVELLATDIARGPIERARLGVYSAFEVQRGLPGPMLARYFERRGDSWVVRPALRRMVEFREWNLLTDLRPLGTFDVIFCRNVLIYFDAPTKAQVLGALAQQLRPDGALFLGGAETVIGLTDAFSPMPGENGVYVPKAALASA